MKKFTTIRRWLKIAIVAELIVLLCLSGVVYAKYTTDKTLTGTVTINAELGSISLHEHNVIKDSYGQYHLTAEELPANKGITYDTVIPGLDIPKDPYVVIENKTTIPAYVFVEVVTNFTPNKDGINFNLSSDWNDLGRIGPHGGKVYVFKDTIDRTFGTNGTGTISILENDANGNSIFVSQNIKELTYRESNINKPFYPTGSVSISFYAYMGQAAGMTAASVFSFITSGT